MSENIKRKLTKEELAEKYREYYDWLDSVYPLESFELQKDDGEIVHFYHGWNSKALDGANHLGYYILDKEFAEFYEQNKKQQLCGIENSQIDISKRFNEKGFINIDTKEKIFNFGIEWDYARQGYGSLIYNNYLKILDMLGIQDKDDYVLRVYGNSQHEFLKRLQTKELVSKTNVDPDTENATQILKEFTVHPHRMLFSEFNTIIQYAIDSNISAEEIGKAINSNGFNIFYSTVNSNPSFESEDVEKFKSFNITNLKLSSMHMHFIGPRNFGFLEFLNDVSTNIDVEDASLEFSEVFRYVREEYEKAKKENRNIPFDNLKQFGELEYIILNWAHSGLLFRHVHPEIQEIVKRQAISKFEEFDPDHSYSWNMRRADYNSMRTFQMLQEAGLMNKDTYIALYQKALNRNYDLKDFDTIISSFISSEERQKAKAEIRQHEYYPSPKGEWQKSLSNKKGSKASSILVSKRLSKNGNTRDTLKQEILKQGIAKKTKIKTDMTGTTKDGKTFVVDNLKDWLFGVPGTHGNIKFQGNHEILLPPQTPFYAVNLIQKTLKDIESHDSPNTDER